MITGNLVCLTPILPGDLPQLFLWTDDREAALQDLGYRPPTWKGQEAFWLHAAEDPELVLFAIRLKEQATLLGCLQIYRINGIHRSAMLGLRIGDAARRGKGYGGEALRLGIAYCWDQLNLSRLGLTVLASNRRAIGLYESLGFQQEGCLRQALFIDGRWVDQIVMGLLHPSRVSG